MKITNKISTILPVVAVGTFAASYAQEGQKHPNVLLIITDDQGYGDFGFTGNKLVETPAIDRLASESAMYTNFVTCPASSPARASIYTGRQHLLTGVWGVPPRANMREDEAMMQHYFKAAGYRTLLVGKQDSSQPVNTSPWDSGWDEAMTVTGYQQKDPRFGTEKGPLKVEGYTSELITERAIQFIGEQKNEPWFVSLNQITPHMPWVCAPEYKQMYKAKGCSDTLSTCWGAITQMDRALGKLFDKLRESGQDQNTIIMFVSDNGATGPEIQKLRGTRDDDVPGEDWAKRNIAGMRGYKSLTYENGVRVPLLVKYPGIQPGERRQLAATEDMLPTLLELAGIERDIIAHQPFTGISLTSSLKQASLIEERPDIFRITISFLGSPKTKKGIIPDPDNLKYEDHHLMVHGQRFKYHALVGGGCALYDMENDLGEKIDVSSQYPEVTEQMASYCRAWWDKIIASKRAFRMPTLEIGRLLPDRKAETDITHQSCFAQRFSGNVTQAAQMISGFTDEGDKAEYNIHVTTSGSYAICLIGEKLDKCAPLFLEIDGKSYKAVKVTDTEIDFSRIELNTEMTSLVIIAGETGNQTNQAIVKYIKFKK